MENNECEVNEEITNVEETETDLVPTDETELTEVSEESEGSGVGKLVLGIGIATGVGYAIYKKAAPKIKACGKKLKAKREARKRQKTIEYAVEHGLAEEINIATAETLAANTDENDVAEEDLD